jgi:hypothetical protein
MVDLKEYFFNTNHYSDPIIMKFIYDFTDKFNPFLLMELNKEFLMSYLTEMDEMNEWKINDDLDVLHKFIGFEGFLDPKKILCRAYSYSNGDYEIKEVSHEYDNLSYREHREMTTRIQDFQHCMQKTILWLSSNEASTYNQQPNSAEPDIGINHNNLNKKAHELFTYLVENYDKKGKIKFINIFKFLKKVDKRIYAFNFTEKSYRKYILDLNGVKITNFATAAYGYEEKELPILNAFEQVFRKEVSK